MQHGDGVLDAVIIGEYKDGGTFGIAKGQGEGADAGAAVENDGVGAESRDGERVESDMYRRVVDNGIYRGIQHGAGGIGAVGLAGARRCRTEGQAEADEQKQAM